MASILTDFGTQKTSNKTIIKIHVNEENVRQINYSSF